MQFKPYFKLEPLNLKTQMVDIECPHCHRALHDQEKTVYLGKDADAGWAVSGILCPRPECKRFALYLKNGEEGLLVGADEPPETIFTPSESRLIRPETILPNPIPADTPEEIKKDYIEATRVLAISPNASAALSRRCLQNILRERAAQDIKGFKQGQLNQEINQVIKSKTILSSNLNEMLHRVRIVGNFAAHPNKSKSTGLIMPVEPNEAEFNLQVIDKLLFYYYVQLPEDQKILDAIDKKDQEKSP